MNITIVGTGNAGCAHAAMFTLKGHRVTLYKTSKNGNNSNFEYLKQSKKLTVSYENETKTVDLYCVTTDGNKAFKDCDVCFVMVQTLYHRQVAELLANFVKHIKLLFVVPGYMGSLYFKQTIGDLCDYIAEGESTAYDARIISDGHVQILFKNVRNAIGILKGGEKDVLEIMSSLVETYRYTRKNIIDSAMHNPNLIVHTIGAIMSASRIEYSNGNFWMYKEAFTPAIWNLIDKLDAEKMEILQYFGCERIPYVEACKFRNCEDLSVDALKVFKSYAESGSPKGPVTVKTRYILEDVPVGLGLMQSLGRMCNISTPTCDALITIAGALVGREFTQDLRSFNVELTDIA